MNASNHFEKIRVLECRIADLEKQIYLYQKILANLPLGVQVFDDKGTSHLINKKQGELLGLPDLSTGIGKFNVITDPYAVATGVSEIYKKAYEGINHEHTFEYNLGIKENTWDTRKDTRIFNEKIVPITNSKERVDYVLAILEDITEKQHADEELKKRELQLENLNATKDKLFSIIGHDLRNPFNALIVMNNLVSQKIDLNDTTAAKEILEIIQKSSLHALNLLENLLQWSKLQTGSLEFNPTKINFEELVNSIDNLLKANYSEKNLKIKVVVEPYLRINADRYMIETIMRNLITNAIKFSNEGGTIEVVAMKVDGFTQVSVKDNGIGVSKNNIHKLFSIDDNFTTPGTKQEKGSGLGLVLCKEFVEKHGGKIRVESKENEWAKFTFTIKE